MVGISKGLLLPLSRKWLLICTIFVTLKKIEVKELFMTKKLTFKEYMFIGSMLFGLFFGAGNLIFPVHMGQEAGASIFGQTSAF